MSTCSQSYLVSLLLDFQKFLLLYSSAYYTINTQNNNGQYKVFPKTGVISTIQNSFKDYPNATLCCKTKKCFSEVLQLTTGERCPSKGDSAFQQMVFS